MKGLNKNGRWIYFKTYITKLTLYPQIVRVKWNGRYISIDKESLCVNTHFKDFTGNSIYEKDILQYEIYNSTLGKNEFHVRYVTKRKDGVFYLGKSAGYKKIPLREVSSMFMTNLKVIGNTHTDNIPEGVYLDEKLTIRK